MMICKNETCRGHIDRKEPGTAPESNGARPFCSPQNKLKRLAFNASQGQALTRFTKLSRFCPNRHFRGVSQSMERDFRKLASLWCDSSRRRWRANLSG
jgi:hypothetical protein